MEAINYLTDAEGRRKAVIIDLEELKRSGQNGHDVVLDLQEELEDLLAIELTKHAETLPWETVKHQLKQDGIID